MVFGQETRISVHVVAPMEPVPAVADQINPLLKLVEQCRLKPAAVLTMPAFAACVEDLFAQFDESQVERTLHLIRRIGRNWQCGHREV